MAERIQIRRDTAANWTNVNPVLADGELGWETDTGYIKVGDGTTVWTSLLYMIIQVDDAAYGAGWNGEASLAPSQNAVYDKIQTLALAGVNPDITSMTNLDDGGIPQSAIAYTGINDIGIAGKQGFGVGICPADLLPPGMSEMAGTRITGHDDYGNYQFQDGSIDCYVPIHYIKIGSGLNGIPVNQFSTVKYLAFVDETEANTAGYFIPRCFIDGGSVQMGYFVDKYEISKNAWGTGFIGSSIKNGLPISTASTHNPIADLTACAGNYYYEMINAAHARDGVDGAVNANSNWFETSRFIHVNLAMLSMAHGQAASATTYCAWYDGAGVTNYPKGCNDNALGDVDDGTVLYITDGYSNCGKTGSGVPFAKTTHNGQNCGVADLNGNMYEISIGVTSDGTDYFVANESTAMKDFTAGNSGATDHWGATGLAAMMTAFDIPYMAAGAWVYMGSGTNQVLSEALTGNDAVLTSLGLPKDSDGYDATGTNQFGKDGMYQYQLRNELCVRSGLAWHSSSTAGVWGSNWDHNRTYSYYPVSGRFACYPV